MIGAPTRSASADVSTRAIGSQGRMTGLFDGPRSAPATLGSDPVTRWLLPLALPVIGLLILLAAAGRRRPLGGPPGALLARPGDGADQRRAGVPRRRSGSAARRRPPLPRLPRLRHERRLPRPARARDARRPAREAERRLRRRHPGRARHRRRLRRRVGPRPLAGGLRGRHEAPVAAARTGLRAPRRLGRLLARRAASARPRADRRRRLTGRSTPWRRSACRSTRSPPGATSLLYRRRPAAMPLAVAAAFTLLAEAMIAIAFGRNWHASWWEWHVLMALAFGIVACRGPHRVPAPALDRGRLQGLYLEHTAEFVDRRYARALERLATRRPTRGPCATRVQRRGGAAPRAGRRRAPPARRALQPVPLAAAHRPAPRGARRGGARRRAARHQRPLRRPRGLHGLLGAVERHRRWSRC